MKPNPLRIALVLAVVILGAAGCRATPADQRTRDEGVGTSHAPRAATATTAATLELRVTEDGFTPSVLRVRAGQAVKLVVTREVEKTCATDIVIKDFDVHAALPLGRPVEIAFVPNAPGKHRFSCAMDMVGGDLVVE